MQILHFFKMLVFVLLVTARITQHGLASRGGNHYRHIYFQVSLVLVLIVLIIS